jgi:hypothetical protein
VRQSDAKRPYRRPRSPLLSPLQDRDAGASSLVILRSLFSSVNFCVFGIETDVNQMPNRLRSTRLAGLFEPPIVDAIDHMVRRSQFEPAHIQFFRPCGFPYHVVQITAVYGKRPPYPILPNEGPQSTGPGAASTRFAMGTTFPPKIPRRTTGKG